ncbi:MAG: hypothetical protein ACKVOE_05395 [Rickettsiales bacterium]
MLLNIDTQKVYTALLAGGFSAKQAETVIETMRTIDLSQLATKTDLKDLRTEIKADFAAQELKFESRFAKLETDNVLIKWMMGFVLAGILSLVMKAYVG